MSVWWRPMARTYNPSSVDEFRIAAGEVYDVMVEPREDRAYTIFAQSIDRSGYARGTLAPRLGMQAEVPRLDSRALLTMADMGMGHSTRNGPECRFGRARSARPTLMIRV